MEIVRGTYDENDEDLFKVIHYPVGTPTSSLKTVETKQHLREEIRWGYHCGNCTMFYLLSEYVHVRMCVNVVSVLLCRVVMFCYVVLSLS